MAREVKLNHLDDLVEEFEYPCTRDEIVDETNDVTLVLADGTENMGELLEGSSAERYESADELSTEVMNLLPRRAVGEPYQSEGEG